MISRWENYRKCNFKYFGSQTYYDYMVDFILASTRSRCVRNQKPFEWFKYQFQFNNIVYKCVWWKIITKPSSAREERKSNWLLLFLIVVFGTREQVPCENLRTDRVLCVRKYMSPKCDGIINNPNWIQNERMKKEKWIRKFRDGARCEVREINVLIFNSAHTLWSSHRTTCNMNSYI